VTASPRRRRGSLVVVGTGLTGAAQTTLESVAAMERADRLFYLVTDPVTEVWLRQLNASAVTLSDLYGARIDRRRTYARMVSRITAPVREGRAVCAAFYGHPGVFAQPTHVAIRRLRREGYPARMLPGISADACLYADLGLNPGDAGIQSFEATDFLLARRRYDPSSALLLWQVGVLGERQAERRPCRPERLRTLATRLQRRYPPAHRVILYYAATFPADDPIVQRVPLSRLPAMRVDPLATLYVPPLTQRPLDPAILRWYDES
jgi:hypothetical protein